MRRFLWPPFSSVCWERPSNRERLSTPSTSSVSSSMGRPAIRCFSVSPSRNSIAMKGWSLCSPISWIVQDGSGQKQPAPHGRSGSKSVSPRTRQEETSRQRSGVAWCPQLYRQRLCHRHRVSLGRGNGRWSGRSLLGNRSWQGCQAVLKGKSTWAYLDGFSLRTQSR